MTTITCVVDNAVKKGSHLKSEHGLAFWIETDHGEVMFDTGQTAEVLEQNLAVLDLDARDLSVLAISHAHFDHTGGLEVILSVNSHLDIYANAEIFTPKYAFEDGKFTPDGFEFTGSEYKKRANWHLDSQPQEIYANLWTTGEIVGRKEPEGRSASHHVFKDNAYLPDPYLDDMSLVFKTDHGLVLICGCCHAGLLNTLAHVKLNFKGEITTVIGGTHLMAAEGPLLKHVISVLEAEYPNMTYYMNHCTGDTALEALGVRFGERVHHFTAGEKLTF